MRLLNKFSFAKTNNIWLIEFMKKKIFNTQKPGVLWKWLKEIYSVHKIFLGSPRARKELRLHIGRIRQISLDSTH